MSRRADTIKIHDHSSKAEKYIYNAMINECTIYLLENGHEVRSATCNSYPTNIITRGNFCDWRIGDIYNLKETIEGLMENRKDDYRIHVQSYKSGNIDVCYQKNKKPDFHDDIEYL
ncbi:hypothetical protein [Bifidobacterium scaligerum]|uniref:hypothetical protein n=1 Tax=Bifidobacterium scaligerum TaxID=2052656 RepID=UPI001054B26A|nr:hypothetical protein [Bifidobacterium scaligerum]